MKLYASFVLLIASLIVIGSTFANFTSQDVKCHVCKATVREMEEAIGKEDPKKKVNVSGFRLDGDGNSITKTVPLIKSELYLTELMENICDKMDDYLKATYKKDGRFTLLKMVVDGKMNSESSEVDFVQDGDLNKSLKHFCLEILDDNDAVFMEAFAADNTTNDMDIKICSEKTYLCNEGPSQEDYEFDNEKEEL